MDTLNTAQISDIEKRVSKIESIHKLIVTLAVVFGIAGGIGVIILKQVFNSLEEVNREMNSIVDQIEKAKSDIKLEAQKRIGEIQESIKSEEFETQINTILSRELGDYKLERQNIIENICTLQSKTEYITMENQETIIKFGTHTAKFQKDGNLTIYDIDMRFL